MIYKHARGHSTRVGAAERPRPFKGPGYHSGDPYVFLRIAADRDAEAIEFRFSPEHAHHVGRKLTEWAKAVGA